MFARKVLHKSCDKGVAALLCGNVVCVQGVTSGLLKCSAHTVLLNSCDNSFADCCAEMLCVQRVTSGVLKCSARKVLLNSCDKCCADLLCGNVVRT